MHTVGRNFSSLQSKENITFKDLGLPEKFVTHLEAVGYAKPTHIQTLSIPALAVTRDVLIKSQTGSGKTLAYLLPILRHLGEHPDRISRHDGTKAIILAPTRELAVQIENVYRTISKPYYWIVASTLMGGERKKSEKARLRKGVHIIIGTPGRIRDHMESTQSWNLSRVRWFVLDEADRLMDLGFEDTVRFIFNYVDNLTNKNREDERQRNILVSATLTKGSAIERLASEIMKNPFYVGFDAKSEDTDDNIGDSTTQDTIENQPLIDTEELEELGIKKVEEPIVHETPSSLEQLYVQMSTRHRLVALASFLRLRVVNAQKSQQKCKIIVFASTCAEVEFLHKVFTHTFWPDNESVHTKITESSEEIVEKAKTDVERALDQKRRQEEEKLAMKATTIAQQPRIPLLDTQIWKLHGNLLQKTRTSTYFEFSKAAEGILFCTDVAARGLDLPAVDWIVQYDAPEDTQDYIHRVGRTARIGHSGKAIIFLVDSELEYLTVLRRHGITLTPMSLERVLVGLHIGIQRSVAQQQQYRQMPAGAILQKQLEKMVKSSKILSDLAKEAYLSYLRAYAAYPKSLKLIFHPKKLHFGEVAHSFGLTERPTDLGKKAAETHEQTKSTINPAANPESQVEMSKSELRYQKYAGGKNNKMSLHQMAKKQSKRGDVQEFI